MARMLLYFKKDKRVKNFSGSISCQQTHKLTHSLTTMMLDVNYSNNRNLEKC